MDLLALVIAGSMFSARLQPMHDAAVRQDYIDSLRATMALPSSCHELCTARPTSATTDSSPAAPPPLVARKPDDE